MIIGQTLHMGESTTIYYSPWFSSQGNAMQVVCDVIESAGLALVFKIEIQTKKSEDSDLQQVDATRASTPKTITLGTNKQTSFEGGALLNDDEWNTGGLTAQQGLRDLVRFQYELSGGSAGDFVHFRMLVGSWLSN